MGASQDVGAGRGEVVPVLPDGLVAAARLLPVRILMHNKRSDLLPPPVQLPLGKGVGPCDVGEITSREAEYGSLRIGTITVRATLSQPRQSSLRKGRALSHHVRKPASVACILHSL